jgi:hypothetical protein
LISELHLNLQGEKFGKTKARVIPRDPDPPWRNFAAAIMSTGDLYNGWPTRATWAFVCWCYAYRYSYLIDVSLAFWKAANSTFDRSGWALVAMTEKLPRDVAANTAKIDSAKILERLFHAPRRGNCDELSIEPRAEPSGYGEEQPDGIVSYA